MGNLKPIECGLERIIDCWCSLWKCASCPQAEIVPLVVADTMVRWPSAHNSMGKKRTVFQCSMFPSEMSGGVRLKESWGGKGAESCWPLHPWWVSSRCSCAVEGLWSRLLSKETDCIGQRCHPSNSWAAWALWQAAGDAESGKSYVWFLKAC